MIEFAHKLWPLSRSLTGRANRQALELTKENLKGLETL